MLGCDFFYSLIPIISIHRKIRMNNSTQRQIQPRTSRQKSPFVNNLLLWFDAEMDDLGDRGHLLEVSIDLSDNAGDTLSLIDYDEDGTTVVAVRPARHTWFIKIPDGEELLLLTEFSREEHSKQKFSGGTTSLIDMVNSSAAVDYKTVDNEIYNIAMACLGDSGVALALAGFGLSSDRRFIDRFLPKVSSILLRQVIDVEILKSVSLSVSFPPGTFPSHVPEHISAKDVSSAKKTYKTYREILQLATQPVPVPVVIQRQHPHVAPPSPSPSHLMHGYHRSSPSPSPSSSVTSMAAQQLQQQPPPPQIQLHYPTGVPLIPPPVSSSHAQLHYPTGVPLLPPLSHSHSHQHGSTISSTPGAPSMASYSGVTQFIHPDGWMFFPRYSIHPFPRAVILKPSSSISDDSTSTT